MATPQAVAAYVTRVLAPVAGRITVAGSIRRGVASPQDVDVVLTTRNKQEVYRRMQNIGTIISAGPQQISARVHGVRVDVYFAEAQAYGAQLLTRTGPAGSNIGLRMAAKRQGMTLNQYGLWRGKKRVAGQTERGIRYALGVPYKQPSKRGR
jgi:DNA polymerase (family 10)